MDNVPRQMHQRALAVAVAGMVLGALSQASLIGASDRSQSSASSRTTTTRHVSYSAKDISLACAAVQNRSRQCGNVSGNTSMEIADRGSARAAN
jgi:hypothetical protein